ncbi:hypothetical protein HY251_12665 [bacterium]|nr:hypothetical protein [bacterium]
MKKKLGVYLALACLAVALAGSLLPMFLLSGSTDPRRLCLAGCTIGAFVLLGVQLVVLDRRRDARVARAEQALLSISRSFPPHRNALGGRRRHVAITSYQGDSRGSATASTPVPTRRRLGLERSTALSRIESLLGARPVELARGYRAHTDDVEWACSLLSADLLDALSDLSIQTVAVEQGEVVATASGAVPVALLRNAAKSAALVVADRIEGSARESEAPEATTRPQAARHLSTAVAIGAVLVLVGLIALAVAVGDGARGARGRSERGAPLPSTSR